MYKGIGPNKLGSPLKQTAKKPIDLPPAWSSQAAKDDYKQYSEVKEDVDRHNSMFSNLQSEVKTGKNGHYRDFKKYAEKPIEVDNTIESFVIGGGAAKGLLHAAKKATGGKVAAALGTKAAHGAAEAAHVGEQAYHFGH